MPLTSCIPSACHKMEMLSMAAGRNTPVDRTEWGRPAYPFPSSHKGPLLSRIPLKPLFLFISAPNKDSHWYTVGVKYVCIE